MQLSDETETTTDYNLGNDVDREPDVQMENEPNIFEQVASESEEEIDEYSPNYTFKVMDKEQEFDEFLRPVITNAEQEKRIRELYEKANGIDYVKEKNNQLKSELEKLTPYQKQLLEQNQALAQLGKMLKNKDFASAFRELEIKDEDILKYALEKVNYQDLSPEQKMEYDSNVESKQRLYKLEQQNQLLQQQMQQNQASQVMQQLDNYLSTGQLGEHVKSFDARVGQPGAFKNEVLNRARTQYYATGQDMTAQQAVEEVLRLYGGPTQTTGNYGTENSMNYQQIPPQQMAQSQEKPVIPNLKSGGSSPARKLPRSIEDLKKAAEAFGN